jgi:hypothetical protein
MSHKSMDVIGISCGIACDISSVISFCSIVMLVIWLWKLKSEFAWSGRLPSLRDVNQNDATTNDVENDSIINCNQSRNKVKSTLSYKESRPQSVLSEHQPSLMSNMYPSSVMSKISNTLPHLDGSLPDHANSDLSFQSQTFLNAAKIAGIKKHKLTRYFYKL